ncbi:hypothetical protein H0H93_004669 [Arthromyces matolae]|nr:hypothetical protein H0H93_004669 [Arthromyces matolae]
MSIYTTNFQELWKDGRFFAQIHPKNASSQQISSDESLVGVVLAVASNLLGEAYHLGTVAPSFEPTQDLAVYDTLTQILPVLSEQSAFFWDRAARPLASYLATAKYPIHAQASHLIFWWARLGGLMGVTSVESRVGCQETSATVDGSNIEYSWAIPSNTDPSEEFNRRVRFSIDPFHPEHGHRLPGGALFNYLISPEGSMGLVKPEPGSNVWKEAIEKWLFPDLGSDECLDGMTYGVAFDMAPSGAINLRMYYCPPFHPSLTGIQTKTNLTLYRRGDMEPMKDLVKILHPSLEAPLDAFLAYSRGEGKDRGLSFSGIAFDVCRPEKNRLKVIYTYPFQKPCLTPIPRPKVYTKSDSKKLTDIISDMTLGGRLTGPRVDDAMANLSKFFKRLFPYTVNEVEPEIKVNPVVPGPDGKIDPRMGIHLLYYFEFVVGEPLPYAKVYFMMPRLGTNDYDTARSTELFLNDAGKPGAEGWMTNALAHAHPHRALGKRNGIHTAVGFATKPKGWEVINYYSPEFFAPERAA